MQREITKIQMLRKETKNSDAPQGHFHFIVALLFKIRSFTRSARKKAQAVLAVP
jgi:hypothetical protein